MGSAHPQLVPYQAFEGSDGDYIVIGILNERFWVKLCTMLGDDALASATDFASNSDRVAHRESLLQILRPLFRQRTVADWERLCEKYDVPYARVNSLRDLFHHPQAVEQGLVVTMQSSPRDVPTVAQAARFGRTPASYHAAPPELGADTAAVLLDHGFDTTQIEQWGRQGIIGLS